MKVLYLFSTPVFVQKDYQNDLKISSYISFP